MSERSDDSLASADLGSLLARARRLGEGAYAMAQAELRKLRHDYLDIFTRMVQPLLWLFVFGTAMRHVRKLGVAGVDYRSYLVPGVMAQSALFVAIFFGLAIIWERDAGQLQRLLATPLPRLSIVLGKASGAGVRALAQASVLLAVVAIAGIKLDWVVWRVLAAIVLLVLGTAAFACLSMLLASLLKTMPLFFASSALYPLSIMPLWLRLIARANPLTYEVQGLRSLLLGLGGGGALWLDFAVCGGFFVALAALAARAYPRAIV